jgi:hypothetical protein
MNLLFRIKQSVSFLNDLHQTKYEEFVVAIK